MKRLTTKEFIEKAKKVYGDKYNYSLVNYCGSNKKVKIICKTHGEFEQVPRSHLSGFGCSKCNIITNVKFIKNAKNIHDDKYDYSLVNYINNYTKIKIICKKHGIFEQSPNSHLSAKQGCPKCYGNKKLTLIEFIKKAKHIHNNKYDYSLVEYKNNRTKIKIICPKHGIFEQSPNCHFNRGCDKCGGTYKPTTKEFIEKARIIHGSKYNYSLINYKNSESNIKIICSIHGMFEQSPTIHINKNGGCQKCANLIKGNTLRLNNSEFIEKAKIIHGNKYDYSKIEYINSHKKVKIICTKHGEFMQQPNTHLNKRGCPICKESKGENMIRKYLKNNNIKYKRQKTFDGCNYKNKLRFDFYLPDYNFCIEYNGIQHYIPIEYFGGIEKFKINKKRFKIKKEFCEKNNIKLLIIKYNENIIEKLTSQLFYHKIEK